MSTPLATMATEPPMAALSQPAPISTASPVSSGLDVVSSLTACHHILKGITRHADRNTQVVLLRVSKEFHDLSGKQVYSTITFTGMGIWDVLRGALIGRGLGLPTSSS